MTGEASPIIVNGRYREQRLSGIQRVAHEIQTRLSLNHRVMAPVPARAHGAKGHAWEQTMLPLRAGGRLIWGPCNTGPLAYRNQVLTIHGAGVFDHPEWFSPTFVQVNTRLWPLLARRVRRLVTVSHFSQSRLSAVLGVPASKIDVVWNGVSPHFAPASPLQIAAARGAVGMEPDAPYFATLSTIEPRKNLKLVLDAFARARPRLPPASRLLVMGPKGSVAVFGERETVSVSEADGVLASGFVPDELLPPLLSGSMGVLYPSLYEGFGLPVLEAMACGAPAVTTRLTSLPEVGGDAAIYVDPVDADDLADILVRLAGSADMRRECSERGIARARAFTWEAAAARMDEILSRYA